MAGEMLSWNASGAQKTVTASCGHAYSENWKQRQIDRFENLCLEKLHKFET